MGGMDLWVSYPKPFARLDRYINIASANKLDTQFGEPSPAFAPPNANDRINLDGVPFVAGQPQAADTHFDVHWIGHAAASPNDGGLYWPYISVLDVGKLLHCALETATKTIAARLRANPSKRKKHITLWICSQPYPDAAERASIRSNPAKQASLFRAAVLEFDDIVQTVISTPEPDPAIIMHDAQAAAAAGGNVAFPIPQLRIHPFDMIAKEWFPVPDGVISAPDIGVDAARITDITADHCKLIQVADYSPPLEPLDDEQAYVAVEQPAGYLLSFPTDDPTSYRIQSP